MLTMTNSVRSAISSKFFQEEGLDLLREFFAVLHSEGFLAQLRKLKIFGDQGI